MDEVNTPHKVHTSTNDDRLVTSGGLPGHGRGPRSPRGGSSTPAAPDDKAGERVSIHILRYANGRRAAVLTLGNDPPCPWVATHLLDLSRKGLKIRTVRNRALGIARLLLFCRRRGIDYVERCRGSMLTEHELMDLALDVSGDASTARACAKADYSAAIAFLCSIATRLQGADEPDAHVRMDAFRSNAKEHGPHPLRSAGSPRLGLTDPCRALFLDAIMPGSRNRGSMSFRNYVVMRTAYDLGMRTGELLGLKVCDLNLHDWPATLEIVERDSDPEDPRALPARAKTGGRRLPLGAKLSLALQQLVDDRGELPHPYVFTNRDGAPLSERGLRGIYHDLRRTHPELGNLCNHMLRHDWNDRWNRMVAEQGWDPEESVRHQRHAMGWSSDSDMPTRYGRRSIEEMTSAKHLKMQEEDLHRSGQAKR